MSQKINPHVAILATVIISIAALRIPISANQTPISNFTPIGAMALFGGAYFKQHIKAIGFPLLTLLISDLVINIFLYDMKYGVMYGGWYWVYGGFVMITLLGRIFLKKISVKSILLTGIASSLLYWLIVDFGVFLFGCTNVLSGQQMDHSFNSLVQCYIQGAPFMKSFLIGTLIYSAVMFGFFEWIKQHSIFIQKNRYA